VTNGMTSAFTQWRRNANSGIVVGGWSYQVTWLHSLWAWDPLRRGGVPASLEARGFALGG